MLRNRIETSSSSTDWNQTVFLSLAPERNSLPGFEAVSFRLDQIQAVF